MSILAEIKRRNIIQVAAVYAVVAWLLIQIAATIEEPLSLPDWFDTFVIILLAIGFPIALILTWAYELTPGGVVRDHGSEERSPVADAEQARTARGAPSAVLPIRYKSVAFLVVSVFGLMLAGYLTMKFMQLDAPVNTSHDDLPIRRFPIDMPITLEESTRGGRPEIVATDGQRVIFSGVTGQGRRQLYSRSFDSLDALPIRGTGDAGRISAISPDGEWIAYLDILDGLIKKVPVTGGVPIEICDAGVSTDGDIAWGADGNIVFAVDSYNGIMQVSSSGGVPEPLTFPENEEVHKHPAFSPDGTTLVFTIGDRGNTFSRTDMVAALLLESKEQKTLLAGASPQVTSSGHLIYFKNKALWAVTFDAGRLQATSEGIAVADDVRYSVFAHYRVADDGTLVYHLATRFKKQPLVWVDRSGNEEKLPIDPQSFFWPRLSPSGNRMSVTIAGPDGTDLWLYSLTRGTRTRLTSDQSMETNAVWTQDGQHIYYSANRVDDLFRATTDGTGIIEQLTDTQTPQFANALTPDGRELIFHERGNGRSHDLAVLTLSDEPSSKFLLRTEFGEQNGRLSPDGRWLAYDSNESGQPEIYVRPYPDVHSAVWPISSDGGRQPIWAKSGKEIFYWGSTEMMMVAVATEPTFSAELPEALFSTKDKYDFNSFGNFDVDAADERFLLIKESSLSNPIIVVQNWLDEVVRKVGVN